MIVPASQATDLLRGDTDELHVRGRPPALGSVHQVQPGVGKPSVCRVAVLDVWPHNQGGHVVRVEIRWRPKPRAHKPRVVPDRPRFLKRGGGYTSDPRQAMRGLAGDPSPDAAFGLGVPPEPQAVSAAWQFEESARLRLRDHAVRLAREVEAREAGLVERARRLDAARAKTETRRDEAA